MESKWYKREHKLVGEGRRNEELKKPDIHVTPTKCYKVSMGGVRKTSI